MQFELWQLFIVGVLYLGLLFVIATATDRGWIPESVARHPMVYTLSIGVYATSWSFYGSVGFAEKEGRATVIEIDGVVGEVTRTVA